MASLNPRNFWSELTRRRVVRAALYYIAAAWVLAQVLDLLLDAFEASRYMRFVVAGLVLGLPVATVLAWMFDLTPSGIERTATVPAVAADPPEDSIAVLPFANLSNEPENEYFSDGLAEEIRNQWVWRLPHVVNHAHLRLAAGDARGRDTLRELMTRADEVRAEGIVSVEALYWVASAHAVRGEGDQALDRLEEAVTRGWCHAWWARHDWNWAGFADDSRFRDLLARGGPSS